MAVFFATLTLTEVRKKFSYYYVGGKVTVYMNYASLHIIYNVIMAWSAVIG